MTDLKLSLNASRVLKARYLQRDTSGRIIETPEQLFRRSARAIAHGETLFSNGSRVSYWEEEFYDMLISLDFLPNSPTLMNAGTPLGQLSACFVLPVEDTIEGILQTLTHMALITRAGGGIGFSFSKLRPKGDVLVSSGGEASGPVSFMKIFDTATEHIKQGGKRRGANMGVLRVDHPDILEFITVKLDEKQLRNFNISVGVTNHFMEAVQQEQYYTLVHPKSGNSAGKLQARHVFDTIVEAAWRCGDPGILFLDAINKSNPTPHLDSIEATNPCGEIPLLNYESCNLGSINLAHMISHDHDGLHLDWKKLRSTVHKAVRFLDNVIEVNRYPLLEIKHMTSGNRKIGLGVMGFAEMLIRLGISYDSDEAVLRAEQIMKAIAEEAFQASQDLAEERGVFPNWENSLYKRQGIKVRNATRVAIAPTGTISIIAGTSNGIEPLFALAYRRTNVLGGRTLYECNQIFLEHIKRYGLNAETFLD
ncbi:MAG: adenosylcobalamin-dependent ribonucleoside-diphosphate reductase, partial [Thermodesulfobacteriota bacterium]|nr:adenosylcobalamin-dependent ribonucleoside-diphosphate reductase [Thermodesulfobacteriota bacterium]